MWDEIDFYVCVFGEFVAAVLHFEWVGDAGEDGVRSGRGGVGCAAVGGGKGVKLDCWLRHGGGADEKKIVATGMYMLMVFGCYIVPKRMYR